MSKCKTSIRRQFISRPCESRNSEVAATAAVCSARHQRHGWATDRNRIGKVRTVWRVVAVLTPYRTIAIEADKMALVFIARMSRLI